MDDNFCDESQTLPPNKAADALGQMICVYVGTLCPDGTSGQDLARVFPTFTDTTLDAALKNLVTIPRFVKNQSPRPSLAVPEEVIPRTPWQFCRYRQDSAKITPRWDHGEGKLVYDQYKWTFDEKAIIVISILDAFEANSWYPVERVERWMPEDEKLRGLKQDPHRKFLESYEIRDALTVIKEKTRPVLMWHLRGRGAWWEAMP
jgi:hypothetical protein